jgi:hypothetical protein
VAVSALAPPSPASNQDLAVHRSIDDKGPLGAFGNAGRNSDPHIELRDVGRGDLRQPAEARAGILLTGASECGRRDGSCLFRWRLRRGPCRTG